MLTYVASGCGGGTCVCIDCGCGSGSGSNKNNSAECDKDGAENYNGYNGGETEAIE